MRFAAFAVVFLILPGLRAQEDYAPPTPTDAAKSLQRLVGDWQGEGVSRQGPGADPVPWTAQCKTTSLFGGFFVREELEVQLGMPSTMRMTTLYGHDRSHDSLVQYNMGNTGGMMRSELRWVDADTLVAFASARFRGQLHVGRAIWRFDGDSYTYRYERATDTGDWFVEIDGKFTRVDAAKVNMTAGAFMEMPAPAEMGALDALCGDWRLAGEMKMVGVPDMEVSGHETVRSIYGGHLVESVAKSDPMPDGGVWEGLSWFAWDADHGHYWSLMTDSMGEFTCTPMWHYSDDAFVSVDARMMDGQPSTNRIIIHLQGGRMTGFESHTVAGTDAPFRSFNATYTPVEKY